MLLDFVCVFPCRVCASPAYGVSAVPGRHHDLALLQQQEVRAALPAAVDLLDECGQILQALLPPLLQEEELQVRWKEVRGDISEEEEEEEENVSLSGRRFSFYTSECGHQAHGGGRWRRGRLRWKITLRETLSYRVFSSSITTANEKKEKKKKPTQIKLSSLLPALFTEKEKEKFSAQREPSGPSWGAGTSGEMVLHGGRPRVTMAQMD